MICPLFDLKNTLQVTQYQDGAYYQFYEYDVCRSLDGIATPLKKLQ